MNLFIEFGGIKGNFGDDENKKSKSSPYLMLGQGLHVAPGWRKAGGRSRLDLKTIYQLLKLYMKQNLLVSATTDLTQKKQANKKQFM